MSRLNRFLDGIKVLDLTQYLPGPLATLMLADMGAEVIKIEPPGGDQMRDLGPRDAAGESIYFSSVNAGKITRSLDLKDEKARAEFLKLVESTDILFESYRPGVMERLGVGYETLSKLNPRLIYCAINGFGRAGPLSNVAAHDSNYLALSGALYANGDEHPIYFDPPIADCTSSFIGLSAVLAALHARAKDGKGCSIDVGIADVIMPFQTFALADLGRRGEVPKRRSNYLNGGSACYRIYRTRDGRHVALGAIEEKFWQAFCERAGRLDWIAPQWDAAFQPTLVAQLSEYFSTFTLDQCVKHFADVDCCLTPILDLREAVRSSHHAQRGLVVDAGEQGIQALFPAWVDGEPPLSRKPLKSGDALEGSRR